MNKGYNLLVSSSAYQPKLEAQQIRELVARGADGLLLIGYERDEAVYEYLDPTWDSNSVGMGLDTRLGTRLCGI